MANATSHSLPGTSSDMMDVDITDPEADSPSSLLLQLADDGQRVIFEQLSDPLIPSIALALSSCCKDLRAISLAARTELQTRHNAARRLCARVNMSCVQLVGAKELLWYGQGLTANHLTTLGMLLRTNAFPFLQVLNLSINKFGADGMRALLAELGHASRLLRLTTLDLTGNALGPAGAAALAATLGRGALPKLEVLKLGRNDIGNEGLIALAPPLRQLKHLKDVYLHSNQIGDEGVEALLANLGSEELRRLRTLNLERNRISCKQCNGHPQCRTLNTLRGAFSGRMQGATSVSCCGLVNDRYFV